MEDKKYTEEANKILDRRIAQTKIIDKYKETITNELDSIKKSILSEATLRLKDWYSNKETDLNVLNEIVNKIDYKLSEKSSVTLKAVNSLHGLTGKYVDSIEFKYKMKFNEDENLEYSEKESILLESIKLRNKLSKLSKLK